MPKTGLKAFTVSSGDGLSRGKALVVYCLCAHAYKYIDYGSVRLDDSMSAVRANWDAGG